MSLIRRAYGMPERMPRVAWQFEVGHIVLVHDDRVPKGTQGIVYAAWLDGTVGVMMPDFGRSQTFPFDVLELVGVMPRFTSETDGK